MNTKQLFEKLDRDEKGYVSIGDMGHVMKRLMKASVIIFISVVTLYALVIPLIIRGVQLLLSPDIYNTDPNFTAPFRDNVAIALVMLIITLTIAEVYDRIKKMRISKYKD